MPASLYNRSTRTGRRIALTAVLAVTSALAGCNWERELEYGSHISRLQPTTSSNEFAWHQTELAHLVHFAPAAPSIDPVEMVRLNQFIDQVGVQSNDEIKAVAGGPMAQQRANAVVQAFALRGYRITPVQDATLPEGDVTVSIRRVVYTASACLRDGNEFEDGGLSVPLGCANALNLQSMVANPEELIGGLASDSVETVPAVGAIRRYRSGDITPLRVLGTTGSSD